MAAKKAPENEETVTANTNPQPSPAAPPVGDLHGGQKGHLTVRAPHDGYRRAGRAWTVAGETVRVADFTPAQVAALKADPRLTVLADA
jgi:hypothetical protein